jgi:hypothetical protein
MIACLDVDYREATAHAAGLAFHGWSDAAPTTETVIPVVGVQGVWVLDREYGLQFRAEMLTCTPPTTTEGIEKYP